MANSTICSISPAFDMYCILLHRIPLTAKSFNKIHHSRWLQELQRCGFRLTFREKVRSRKSPSNVVDSSRGRGFKTECFRQWEKSGAAATHDVKNILYEHVKNGFSEYEPIKKHNRGTSTQSNLAVMPQCPK